MRLNWDLISAALRCGLFGTDRDEEREVKLKSSLIAHNIDGKQVMIDIDRNGFKGMVRSNATAAFIVDQLKTETTREEILNKMAERYDAPRDMMGRDLDEILAKLRQIGALEE